MNYNDIIAQQQEALNTVVRTSQHVTWAYMAISLAGVIVGAFVIYLFYARLRDTADELRKFRIAFEFANKPEQRPVRRQPEPSSPSARDALKAMTADAKYMPH